MRHVPPTRVTAVRGGGLDGLQLVESGIPFLCYTSADWRPSIVYCPSEKECVEGNQRKAGLVERTVIPRCITLLNTNSPEIAQIKFKLGSHVFAGVDSMNRTWILMVVAASSVLAFAMIGSTAALQSNNDASSYQPAVPSPSIVAPYGGGYGRGSGYSGGSTPAGSAMNGMASVISAAGDYNLSTSAAAVNMTQAQRNEIQNRQQWTNAYFSMQDTNRAARAAKRRPPPTMEQLTNMARQGIPKPLSPSQVDPVTGKIHWPSTLMQPEFDSQRDELDQVFAARAANGNLGFSDQAKAQQAVDAMFDELKAQIRDMPPSEYVACRHFLRSLSYAATKTELE